MASRIVQRPIAGLEIGRSAAPSEVTASSMMQGRSILWRPACWACDWRRNSGEFGLMYTVILKDEAVMLIFWDVVFQLRRWGQGEL